MIDTNLVDYNSWSLGSAIVNSNRIDKSLASLSGCLDPDMQDKISQYLEQNYHSKNWHSETRDADENYTWKNRYKLTWDPDTVLEELYLVCQNQTQNIEEFFGKKLGPFRGITVWRDHPGYKLDWHKDNVIIGTNLQIYLSCRGDCPGTQFKTDSGDLALPFVANTGYLMDQADSNQMLHRVNGIVPEDAIRYSLFAMWGKIL